MNELREELRVFVIDNFLFGHDDGTIKPDTSLLEMGVIDSTGVLELISYIEKQYCISVQDSEIIPENLDSIDNLARFIQHRSVRKASVHSGR